MLDLEQLKHIVDEWSFTGRPVPASVPRRVLARSLSWTPDIALVVQGVRRCGKSTLLTQLMTQRELPPGACIYVNHLSEPPPACYSAGVERRMGTMKHTDASTVPVVLRPGEDGYIIAECPVIPGCISQGKSRAEALANIREAISLCIEAHDAEAGWDLPKNYEIVDIRLAS